jgi:hypothetical protein
MRSGWTRRGVIKALAATAGVTLFGSFAIPPARAIAPAAAFAIAQAALTVLNAIESLNAKGGGLGKQFAAINLKLDQILQNQVYTLQAIAQLQRSIDALGRQVGGLLTLERCRSLAIAIFDLRDDFERFSSILTPSVGKNKRITSPTAITEYNRLFSTLGTLVSDTRNTFALTNLDAGHTGLEGVNSLLIVGSVLPTLVSLLDTFRSINRLTPELGWTVSQYYSASATLRDALSTYGNLRGKEAQTAQIQEATEALADINALSIWPAIRDSLIVPSTNASPTTRLSICFRTSVLRAFPVVGANPPAYFHKLTDYRAIETFAIDYQIVSLPDALPAQIAYPQMQLAAKGGITSTAVTRPRGTFLLGTNQDPRVPSIATIDERGDCHDGLLAIGKTAVPGGLGMMEPDGALDDSFNQLVARLPRYNNALIAQEQIVQLQKLATVLGTALDKFDAVVDTK